MLDAFFEGGLCNHGAVMRPCQLNASYAAPFTATQGSEPQPSTIRHLIFHRLLLLHFTIEAETCTTTDR